MTSDLREPGWFFGAVLLCIVVSLVGILLSETIKANEENRLKQDCAFLYRESRFAGYGPGLKGQGPREIFVSVDIYRCPEGLKTFTK